MWGKNSLGEVCIIRIIEYNIDIWLLFKVRGLEEKI